MVIGLIAARARRRPGRWLPVAVGVCLAAALAGSLVVQGTVAGDESAHTVLAALPPAQQTVRVSEGGPATASAAASAHRLLARLGLGPVTESLLLTPVRLGGRLVRLAAIDPLGRWLMPGESADLGPCAPRQCGVIAAGPSPPAGTLSAPGVRVRIRRAAQLRSAAPLGFSPSPAGQLPVLITDDAAGLGALPALSSVYRAYIWLAPIDVRGLHSWQLAALERRLQRAQSDLLASGSEFTLSAPFDGIDRARAQASAAPRRLLLLGGGAAAALALFVVLAGGGLRRDQRDELDRLGNAGATVRQGLVVLAVECGWISAVGVIAGGLLAIAVAVPLTAGATASLGSVLAHSLLTPAAGAFAVGLWLGATALLTFAGAASASVAARAADLCAVASVAGLALALTNGASGHDAVTVLLAPLSCLAAAVIVARVVTVALRGCVRAGRGLPVLGRVALVGLARAPGPPAIAIAFVAASLGLAGFSLAYRATLLRGAADQAADQVPLDATVATGSTFATPLALAPLSRWRALTAPGAVLAVRRTTASYARGGATVTEPALGVPATRLELIHGWRGDDGSAPLSELAERLAPAGPVRTPGPILPAVTGAGEGPTIAVRVSSPSLALTVTADLRDPGGGVRRLALGQAPPRPATLQARLPRGQWELEALELDEPVGLAVTNGHQNGENPAAATQAAALATIGPVTVKGVGTTRRVALGGWLAVGAASLRRRAAGTQDSASISFNESGETGVIRPMQPSDSHPVPVLADPATAASAGSAGTLPLEIDGLPVSAKVVGVVRRFPTVSAQAAGVVVADGPRLAAALDAQIPGQGQADELWIATGHVAPLRAALRAGPLSALALTARGVIDQRLRSAPIAQSILGALVAAGAVSAVLALIGLIYALAGPARDARVGRDLEEQGAGPRALRLELRARITFAGAAGLVLGLALALLLTRLALAAVRAASTGGTPQPSLVMVTPWAALAVWTVLAVAAIGVAGWIAASRAIR